MIPTADLEQLFDGSVPQMFQRDALRCVLTCYQEAETVRDRYSLRHPVAQWHVPLGRRALIESQLFDVAERYKLCPEYRYTKKGSSPYLAIQAGQFVITESKVDEPGCLPREADFRTENSAVNYNLYAQLEGSPPPGGPIYVILAHVPCCGDSRPACVHWQFPDDQCSCILHHIDLLKRFASPSESAPAESPAVDPKPKLRKEADGKGEAQA
jgi:hypothetical protein